MEVLTPGVLLGHLSCAQERFIGPADDSQPSDLQRSLPTATTGLQDDDGARYADCCATRRLVGILRSQGCLPACTHTCGLPSIPEVHAPRNPLRVDGPSIRDIRGTMAFYQDYFTDVTVPASKGYLVFPLPGRLPDNLPETSESTGTRSSKCWNFSKHSDGLSTTTNHI